MENDLIYKILYINDVTLGTTRFEHSAVAFYALFEPHWWVL